MRLFTARWEILGFGNEASGESWLMTFQHKTLFTSPAVNISCKNGHKLSDETSKTLEEWLKSLGNEELAKVVNDMYTINQISL